MLDTTQDLGIIQAARELAMQEAGLARAAERDKRAVADGEQTRAERLTIEHLVPSAKKFLLDLRDHFKGRGGSRPGWHTYLVNLDVEELAAASIRSAFAAALKRRPLVQALREAGMHLEVIWATSALRERATTAAARKRVVGLTGSRATATGRRKAILRATALAFDEDQADPTAGETGWDTEQLVRAGAPLLSAAISTGLFVVEAFTAKDMTDARFVLTEEGRALVAQVSDLGLLARPIFRPMLAPPRPWEALKGGAYHTDVIRDHVRLVRGTSRAHTALLARGIRDGSMQPVLDAVNAIQGVPLRIDGAVLGLRRWCMDNGVDIPDVLPLRTAVAVPEPEPEGFAGWSKSRQHRHWAQRGRASRVNKGIGPNLGAFHAITKEAVELLAADTPFYQPHSLDFRGRVYPVAFFSHQGGDASRALVRFWNGAALGEDGLWWLQVHCANSGDFGKISKAAFWKRVAWCEDNLELIRATAEEPTRDHRWMKADAPFSFYAACRELVAALDSPDPQAFVSTLPVALDGSNSGVQHYSALMRAPEGRYVNLTPSEEPQDLYAVVALEASQKAQKARRRVAQALAKAGRTYPTREGLVGFLDSLNEDLEGLKESLEHRPPAERKPDATHKWIVHKLKVRRALACALLWAEEGIGRSTVKRNVMTYGYSSTAYGMTEQCREDYMEPLALRVMRGELPAHPFGADEGKAAAGWLGKAVYRSVTRVLPNVAAAMAWLRETAGILAGANKGVLLVTPMGFPMLMRETEPQTAEIELRLLNRTITARELSHKDTLLASGDILGRLQLTVPRVSEEPPAVLRHAQQNGVAPNTIHTMDGCHLQMAVLRLQELGVRDVLLIHDSFAAHPGSVSRMSVVLREQLAALYDGYSPLADIRERAVRVLSEEEGAKLPALPAAGPMDLWDNLLEAAYAFS